MIHIIQSSAMTLTVDEMGAELLSVKVNGKERLWQNNDGSWAGHAPILFPFCGNCKMQIGGVDYGRYFHGFASKKRFDCLCVRERSLSLCLHDDPQTLRIYPFRFAFYVDFEIDGTMLTICYRVHNRSSEPMYFACGAHESYALSDDIENYELVFPETENFTFLLHDGNGHLTGQCVSHGQGRILSLKKQYLADNNTIIMSNLHSKQLLLRDKHTGNKIAERYFPDFDNLLLWHPGDSKMICIEPWQNLPDYSQMEGIEFTEKPGIQILEAQKTRSFTHTIQYF